MREDLRKTTSLCPECLAVIPAEVFAENGKVFIEKSCPKHGHFKELYWGSYKMYKKAEKFAAKGRVLENANFEGKPDCPRTCGLCNLHKTNSALTNIVLTNRCDLNCWYCFFYAGKTGYVYEPSRQQIRDMLKKIREEKPVPGNAVQLSLDYGELIYLRDSDGNIFSKKIGEFVDEEIAKNGTCIKSIPIEHEFSNSEGFEVLSIDNYLSPCFKPLKSVIRHKPEERLFKIKTEGGWEINCTGSHSVFVLGKNSIEAKPVCELKEGATLIGPLDFPQSNVLREVNLLNLIKRFSPDSLNKIMVGPIPKEAIKELGSIEGRRIRWDFIKYSSFIKCKSVKANGIRYFNSIKGKELPTRLEISPELIRLLGYYVGEGCTYRNGVIFTFGLKEKALLEDFLFCLKKIFGKTKFRKRVLHGSALQIFVEGHLYKLFFKILGCGQSALTKSVPWPIFNVSSELKKEFLKAYFNCDGNVKMRDSGYEINHNTVSKKLASDLITLHLQLGLVARVEKSTSKPHLVKKTGQFISSSSLKYRVVICGKENLSNTLWYLEDETLKKKFLTYLAKEEKHAPNYLRLPISITEGLLKHKVKDGRISYLLNRLKQDKSVFKKNLAEIINYLLSNNIPFNSFLNDISHSKIGFFKIRKISRVNPSNKFVYDVSVSGSQAFFAGLGLLLAHNTGGEPLLRKDLLDIIQDIKTLGFDHVQLNTNGIRLALDPKLAARIRHAGCNNLYLSFDGVTPKTNPKNHFEIPLILDNCREAGLGIVLVPTIINSVNDHEVGNILRFGFENIDIIRAVNYQPVSLVGKMPRSEREKYRITIPDVIAKIEEQTNAQVTSEDFFPVPTAVPIAQFVEHLRNKPQYELSTHFACGMATYVFKDGNKMMPITRFLDVEGFVEFLNEQGAELKNGASKYLVGARGLFKINSFVDKEKSPKGLNFAKLLFEVLVMHNYKALSVFHHRSLFIGMMHFMDLYNYDIQRVQNCAIHYATPSKESPIVPFCAFNVVPQFYRDKIQKKFGTPIKNWEKENQRKLKEEFYRRDKISLMNELYEKAYASFKQS